ncbi:hypothetical protein LAT59_04805 [Candidatus Gracilibacteria bacterium]|nr:hypothetical protein [Candidatus Gracilibacteria bacterium]
MQKNIYTFLTLLAGLLYGTLYFSVLANSSSIALEAQVGTGLGSNSSQIQIFPNMLEYHNRGNNSSITGNYFVGSYYDSGYGEFQTNWSTNAIENVRIIGTTSACGAGDYGYRLGGYAYSDIGGYIDFNYNDSIFVYYCMSNQQLRGYAYSTHIGFQNFAGISFDIGYIDLESSEVPDLSDEFNAPESQITTPSNEPAGPSGSLPSPPTSPQPNTQAIHSEPFRFNGQIIEFVPENESLFFIIK